METGGGGGGGGTHPMTVDPGALILSPGTRRRQRGRGVVVLDNLTSATSMTNATVLTPELLSSINPLLADAVAANLARHGFGGGGMMGGLGAMGYQQGPSPDEMVIQARGRRRIPLTFSPDVHSTTPTYRQQRHKMSALAHGGGSQGGVLGGITRLLLPTRTSPRKRLTLNDSPPGRSPNHGDHCYGDSGGETVVVVVGDSCSGGGSGVSEVNHRPIPPAVFQTPSPDKAKRGSPITKKVRVEQSATTTTTSSPPCVLMKGLTQPQLVGIFERLIGKHPEMEAMLTEMLPTPDLAPIEERLSYLKRNIFKALPNTRLESKTDSMSYNRVATHLVALKKAIVEEGRQLLEANQFASVVDYTVMAWSYVRATPVWDNPPHNNVRRQCFKALAAHCMQALKRGIWTQDMAGEIKNRLLALEKDSEELLPCIKHLEILQMKME